MTECWSDGFKTQYSNIPLLQHSILFARLASEIFLSSLQSGFFSNLLGLLTEFLFCFPLWQREAVKKLYKNVYA